MRKAHRSLSVLTVLAIALTACTTSQTPTTTSEPTGTPVKDTNGANIPLCDHCNQCPPPAFRWYVGPSTSVNPDQMAAYTQEINAWNGNLASPFYIVGEILPQDVAYEALANEVEIYNRPDVIGPASRWAADSFGDQWIDLEPYLADHDLSDVDPLALDLWRVEGKGLIGIPVGMSPSAIVYNRDLFDGAGLPYPPHEWGAPYADGDLWDVAKLEQIAKRLTLDANGNDATSPQFDPQNVVQFGFAPQGTDLRGDLTLFGAGSLVDADGRAHMPDQWRTALNWTYEGMWPGEDDAVFMPNDTLAATVPSVSTDLFNSGRVAMAHCDLSCTDYLEEIPNWDLAALPAYQGTITARFRGDMIGIMGRDCIEDVVIALHHLVTNPAMLKSWGGYPPLLSMQGGYIADLDARYPQHVDWDVILEGAAYRDEPTCEARLPNHVQALDHIDAFQALYESTPDLDLDAEIDQLVADLQVIFDAVE